ncbi:MAG: replication initiator protein [Microvirus sp.]|nr:MAG: replication initiator protein [Microvirus sp.]
MPCYHPIPAWKARTVNPSGKRGVVFSPTAGFRDLSLEVPCGQCIGCKLNRSRSWAIRLIHEAQSWDCSCFLTLTYSDDMLPHGGTLVKSHFQSFMKRLRSKVRRKVSFFHCGEYGETLARPHYHAIIFGYDFWTTRTPFGKSKSGAQQWRSAELESLWTHGNSTIGTVNFDSAAYIARYCVKKISGPGSRKHYEYVDEETGEITDRLPEYITMSRRPGIGLRHIQRFSPETWKSDSCIANGKEVPVPKYYDKQLDNEKARRIKGARIKKARKQWRNNTPERLATREEVATAKTNLRSRNL